MRGLLEADRRQLREQHKAALWGNHGGAKGTTMGTKTKEQHTEPGVELVAVEDITALSGFQVRSKIDKKTAREYAVAMQAGEAFPPVRLARIKGSLVLIDGWHRLEARKQLAARSKGARERAAWLTVPAIIKDMSEGQARWTAATANLTNGLRLTRKERAGVFRLYMKQHRYKKPDGKPKSSREISRDLKGVYSHTTVLARIERNYPRVYEAMRHSEDEPKRHEGGPPERQPEEQHLMRDDALSLIREVRETLPLVSDLRERRAIYEAAKALLAELEAGGVPAPDDF